MGNHHHLLTELQSFGYLRDGWWRGKNTAKVTSLGRHRRGVAGERG